MRRAVLALIVGGALLTATACGSANNATPNAAPNPGQPVAASAVAAPPVEATTKQQCEALGQVYSKNMGEFAESLTKMVDGRKTSAAKATQEAAQKSLSSFATAVRASTETATDAAFVQIGRQTSEQLQAKSKDKAFFDKIQTTGDVNTLLGPTLKQWLSPLTSRCS
jgi:hypothetical protein